MSKKEEESSESQHQEAKEPLFSPESMNDETPNEGEKSPHESKERPQNPQDDGQPGESVSSENGQEEEVHLDLQGLEELSVTAEQPASMPSKKAVEKVELDLEGLTPAPPTRPEPRPFVAPKESEDKPEPRREKRERESARRTGPRVPAFLRNRRWRWVIAGSVFMAFMLGVSWFPYQHLRTLRKERTKGPDSARPAPPGPVSHPIPSIDAYNSYRLAPFFVPVSTEKIGRERFLKVTVHLAFKGEIPSDEITRKLLMIRSGITEMLLVKTRSDLQFGEGRIALKGEIKDWLNARLNEGTVQTVYFEEFIIL